MSGFKTSFFLTEDIAEKLRCDPKGPRGKSRAVSMVADRYNALISANRRTIKERFPGPEWKLIKDALSAREWKTADEILGGLLARIVALPITAFTKGNLKREALEEKIRNCSAWDIITLAELIDEELER